jgi:hypothetical protein
MSQKHTPGPWSWTSDDTLVGENGAFVLWFGSHGDEGGIDSEADKALIKAAPDLLAACAAVLEEIEPINKQFYRDGEWNCIKLVKAAILKAKGGAK